MVPRDDYVLTRPNLIYNPIEFVIFTTINSSDLVAKVPTHIAESWGYVIKQEHRCTRQKSL